jgi:hypothetical protein
VLSNAFKQCTISLLIIHSAIIKDLGGKLPNLAFNYKRQKEIFENMANQVGKRYVCPVCGAEFIVTRGGKGELHCCGKKMEIKK